MTISFIGLELNVNTTTANNQLEHELTALPDGRFVSIWRDESGDGSGTAIRGRILNSDGTPSPNDFIVNTTTPNNQIWSAVTALSDGRFVVTWTDYGGDGSGTAIRGRILNSDGTPSPDDFIVNTTIADVQVRPAVAALLDGRFVVTWTDGGGDGSGTAIRGRILNSDGTPSPDDFIVNTTLTDQQDGSSVTALTDGRFVVTWMDNGGVGTGQDIRGRILNSDGTPSPNDFIVNTTTADSQGHSAVTALPDGRFVVTWTDYAGDGSGTAIRGRILNSDGTPSPNDFIVNTTIADSQEYPSVTALPDGRFVVTWTDYGGDGSGSAIRGRILNSDGTPAPDDFIVNTTTSNHQASPAVTALANGLFVVAWQDLSGGGNNSDIKAQILYATPPPRDDLFDTGGGKFNTLADFALAAYKLQPWEPIGNLTNDPSHGVYNATDARAAVLATGWAPITSLAGLPSPPSGFQTSFQTAFADGFYTAGNAAAFAARSGDALVLSFRGTNDIVEGVSPDMGSWLDMTTHYQLLEPFISALNNYVADSANGISKVYVTGHSLGAALVDRYMVDHPDGGGVTYEAVQFAHPDFNDFVDLIPDVSDVWNSILSTLNAAGVWGLSWALLDTVIGSLTSAYQSAVDGVVFSGTDPRITSFHNDSDIINLADFSGEGLLPGDENTLFDGIVAPIVSHSMQLYREAISFIEDESRSHGPLATNLLNWSGVGSPDYDKFIYSIETAGSGTPAILTDDGFTAGSQSDVLQGSVEADAILGGADNDTLHGNSGADILLGGTGNDILSGGSGADILLGGDNDDILTDLDNNNYLSTFGDILDGGPGRDTLDLSAQNDAVPNLTPVSIINIVNLDLTAGFWNGTLTGNDSLRNIEDFIGTRYRDEVMGNGLSNTISTGDSNDELFGLGGSDTLNGGRGVDTMTGGADSDIYYVDTYTDVVIEGINEGVFDQVYASANYALTGGSYVERLATDSISGTSNIILIGNERGQQILGNNGNNILVGGAGKDSYFGYGGNDIYVVDNSTEVITEIAGDGTDAVYTTVSYALASGLSIERLVAAPLSATDAVNLTGNELGQVIVGNNGINTIYGGDGRDSIYGFGSNDVIDGQGDNDALFGGTGLDRFFFREALGIDSGIDRIYDMTLVDRIVIDFIAHTGAKTALTAGQFVVGTAAADANDRVIYDPTSGVFWADPDGSGSQAAILFGVINDAPNYISYYSFEIA